MPRRSKRTVPAAARKNLNLDKEERASPQPKKSMEDLPPEVVTIVLELLMRDVSRKDILGYRRVNSQWKDIIGSILERMIASGHLPAFPVMRIHPRNRKSTEDLLFVRHSTTMIPAGRNPFPSNSLFLYGKDGGHKPNYFPESVRNAKRMALANFMVKSGGYLTNLALEDVIVPGMKSLVTLLSSLPSLKSLRLATVYFADSIIKPGLVFPTAPTLPNLTTLEVKHEKTINTWYRSEPGRLDANRHILYVWLIASYADQLVYLRIETCEQLPALLPRMQYFYSFHDETTLPIATASDSGFKNLKELEIEHVIPNLTFMSDSDLFKLQRISVCFDPPDCFVCDIQDLANFIRKCRNTLVHLRWDVVGNSMIERKAELEGVLPLSAPKLKTLEIHYSPEDDRSDEMRISRLLALFPALETLHILRFHSSNTTPAQELGTVDDDVGHADEIVAAKTRLAALEQLLYERTMSCSQRRAAIPPRAHNREELVEELDQEICDFSTAIDAEGVVIFKRLAALGVKKQEVLVEQLLEREGIWNICPNLKLVSVSSGGNPVGDLCTLRRPVLV